MSCSSKPYSEYQPTIPASAMVAVELPPLAETFVRHACPNQFDGPCTCDACIDERLAREARDIGRSKALLAELDVVAVADLVMGRGSR